MDELLKSLNSPAWWFGTVVAALFINLLSAYLKPGLDKLISQISDTWRTRTERRKDERLKRVARVASNDHEQVILLLEALRYRSRSNGWLAVGTIGLVGYAANAILEAMRKAAGTPLPEFRYFGEDAIHIFLLMSIASVFAAMRSTESAIACESLVSEARKHARANAA